MDFGSALRAGRVNRGWRQQDLVAALGYEFARSTVANVESGRQAPSDRFWAVLLQADPDLAAELEDAYESLKRRRTQTRRQASRASKGLARERDLLGGPFDIDAIRYAYTFRESQAPEEIIEVRRVRATVGGASGFGLKMTNTKSTKFQTETEPLWGGAIVSERRMLGPGRTVYLRRFEFNHRLRKGESHEFALRSWIERDPEPGSEVTFDLTIPADAVTIQLNFLGSVRPRAVNRFGPIADQLVDELIVTGETVTAVAGGVYAVDFHQPLIGHHYGIHWTW